MHGAAAVHEPTASHERKPSRRPHALPADRAEQTLPEADDNRPLPVVESPSHKAGRVARRGWSAVVTRTKRHEVSAIFGARLTGGLLARQLRGVGRGGGGAGEKQLVFHHRLFTWSGKHHGWRRSDRPASE